MRVRSRKESFILEEVPEEERIRSPAGGNNVRNNTYAVDEDDEEELEDDGIPFTKKMRMATRQIHNISDTLVNAKLGLAMSDDKIWAEGLLIFYEIFRFLELSMKKLSSKNEHFQRMHTVIENIERTAAFEADLGFFYGSDFLNSTAYVIRPSVAEYLRHLQTLEQREPLRLLAYVYHLYMGLLSGGQVLKKKRELGNRMKHKVSYLFSFLSWGWGMGGLNRLSSREEQNSSGSSTIKPGTAVTSFPVDGRSMADIKKEIAFTMNDIASDLSRDERNSLIEESMEVFKRNNEIVGSIERTGMTALKNYAMLLLIFVTVGTAVFLYFQQ